MNLQRVAARGLKGLALFPEQGLSFDFGALEDGVYAVTGPNGAGKTTTLELPIAALYGEFPSRPDNSLIQSAEGKDAFLDITVDVVSRGRYRARVNIDAVSRATDAVLELTTPDGLTRPLNDGKVSTYRDVVARELPSLALLLASAFAAQTKTGAFSELSRKDRRDLFAQLLGLEQYETYAQTAREASGILASRVAALRERLTPIEAETTPAAEDEISQTGNDLQAALTAAEHAVQTTTAAVASGEAAVEAARQHAVRYTTATAERDVLVGRCADRERALHQVEQDLAAASEAHRRRRADLEAAAVREQSVHQGALAALESVQSLERARDTKLEQLETVLVNRQHQRDQKIANNRELLDRAAAIRTAAADYDASVRGREAADAAIAECRHQVARFESLLDAARRDVQRAGDPQGALNRARVSAGLIERVPFGEHCAERACQFVVQAVAARQDIPTLEQKVRELQEAHQTLAGLVDQVAGLRRQVTSLEAERDAITQTLGPLKTDADLLVHLNAAETRVAELEAEKRQLDIEADAERTQVREECRQRILRVGAVRTEHLNAIAAIAPALERDLAAADVVAATTIATLNDRQLAIRADITDLSRSAEALARQIEATRAAHDELVAAEAALRCARQEETAAATHLVSIEHQCQAFEQRRNRFKALLADRTRIAAAIAALQDQQAAWEVLTRAFGREGLPVLEIDAAGPGVSALANDLLQACYGGRFVVQLITQEPKADGKGMKEVFEIKVHDAERGTEPDLSDLSGGERVIVDEALRSAIAVYINQRNVLPIATCWRDETIGALDPEAALRYVPLLRRVRELGRFAKVLFISHNRDAAALADAQIQIQDGTICVRYPPFSQSEAA